MAGPQGKVEAEVEVVKEEEITYRSEDFDGATIVRMRLRKADTMQYDNHYKLKLTSTDPAGVLMPLTPFFAARIGKSIDLV